MAEHYGYHMECLYGLAPIWIRITILFYPLLRNSQSKSFHMSAVKGKSFQIFQLFQFYVMGRRNVENQRGDTGIPGRLPAVVHDPLHFDSVGRHARQTKREWN